MTLQQMFDEASASFESEDCAAALPMFARLAVDSRVKPGSLPAATIAVRRGVCLSARAQDEAAEKQIAAGLPILRTAGPEMALDVSAGEQALGEIATRRKDHDSALTHLKHAMESIDPSRRVNLLVKLAEVTQFDGGVDALSYIDEALRVVAASPTPPRQALTAIRTVRGRILMNQGRNKEALAELKQALTLSGGLSETKVSLSQVALRGDLAEASLLLGDKDQARFYLAYTGAGRIAESPFNTAASMAPPQCGPETGLSLEDVAIVEFVINDAGDVPVANTVYTRGNYQVASAFAQAVQQWYWQPQDVAKVPAFYKALTRVEVRCSMSGGQLPGVTGPLRDRFAQWAKPYLGEIDFETAKVGTSLEQLANLAKQREREGNLPAAAAALTARGILNPGVGPDAVEDFDKALRVASAARVPPEVVDTILVFRSSAVMRQRAFARRRVKDAVDLKDAETIITENPTLASDALARDTLILLWTWPAPSAAMRSASEAGFARVADDGRLPDHHPLRQVALLRLANLASSAGKLEMANGYFTRTGLSEDQCSLIGVTPSLKSSGASSSDFPMEALRYGFEGWVNLEFDINSNGTTAHARPVVAYPPFIFLDAATGIARSLRFEASYRPSNKLACSADRQTVQFRIPH